MTVDTCRQPLEVWDSPFLKENTVWRQGASWTRSQQMCDLGIAVVWLLGSRPRHFCTLQVHWYYIIKLICTFKRALCTYFFTFICYKVQLHKITHIHWHQLTHVHMTFHDSSNIRGQPLRPNWVMVGHPYRRRWWTEMANPWPRCEAFETFQIWSSIF